MPNLIAQGPKPEQRWRRQLLPGQTAVVGRAAGRWAVPWDDRISRQHAEISVACDKLTVRRIPTALNPIFFQGCQSDHFDLGVGEHFVIGSTRFQLVDEHVALTLDAPAPNAERTIAHEALQRLRFRDADSRIDALARLPELLAKATSDEGQAADFVATLLDGITAATFVALVEIVPASGEISIHQWDQRDAAGPPIQPSERLIRQAVHERASVIHVWRAADTAEASRFTQNEGADWAFCLPLHDNPSTAWVIYVAGTTADANGGLSPDRLQEEVKFVDLAARLLGNVRGIRRFEREQASLRQFISPVVIEAIADKDPEEVLQPRKTQVSVLF